MCTGTYLYIYVWESGLEWSSSQDSDTMAVALAQGYGTVKFLSSEDAQLAIQECDGLELQGRLLSVKLDQWG